MYILKGSFSSTLMYFCPRLLKSFKLCKFINKDRPCFFILINMSTAIAVLKSFSALILYDSPTKLHFICTKYKAFIKF